MIVRRVGVLVAVVVFAAGAVGCGMVGDGADRRVRLPAALPADLPLPETAVLRSARDLGSKGLNLVFETEAPVAAVAARLRLRLEAGGWVLLSEATVERAVFWSYRKEGRSVALGISRTGEVTVVGVAYQGSASAREGDQG